jgi:hypothetical protein
MPWLSVLPIDSSAMRSRRPTRVHDDRSATAFHADAVVALTGADMRATLNGAPVQRWQAFDVDAGSRLHLGATAGPGARAYISIRGGIDVPEYLGSRSTFILGKFGGHAGRVLQASDMLRWRAHENRIARARCRKRCARGMRPTGTSASLRTARLARLLHRRGHRHAVRGVVEGALQLGSHRRPPRSGRGPPGPRQDGGEAGLIHRTCDNAYAIGAMDFTGDMPILLGRAAQPAGSSAPRSSRRPSSGRWDSCAPAIPSASVVDQCARGADGAARRRDFQPGGRLPRSSEDVRAGFSIQRHDRLSRVGRSVSLVETGPNRST